MGGDWAELGMIMKIYWSLMLGNVVEWYEFTAYGYQAKYMKANFFSGSSVGVWLGFACTFVARPLGAFLLGWIGDRWGRSVSVNLSIIGMLVGTVGQGCLPTQNCGMTWLANLGLIILVILRFVQGLCAAGEIATISTYLTEVSSKSIISRGIALVYITAAVGFLCAKFMIFVLEGIMGEDDMASWGWRLPFLFAIVPGVIAVIGRRALPESGMFEDEKARNTKGVEVSALTKLKQVFSKYWINVLLGIGVTSTYGVLCYGVGVWIQSFLGTAGLSAGNRMVADLISRGLAIFSTVMFGWASDKLGLFFILGLSIVLTTFISIPLWILIAADPLNFGLVVLGYSLGFGLLQPCVGALTYHFDVELFPTEVRNTGMAITFNVAFAIFGGAAPVIALEAAEASWLGPGIFYMLAGALGTISMCAAFYLERIGMIELAYVRREPYYGPLGCDRRRAAPKFVEGNEESSDDGTSSKATSQADFISGDRKMQVTA
mmetsp:Transcript_94779/g.198009  ORF Transcript_94779/g.198009 Transcript_94779/m.198009 type:complete len:490 (+) Transcript_94779:111-1580(+)|eukprot:CAMPEP_0206441026 /NCGR_PEP_ID=MMETSP0324_2-20121206/13059_1 /ASSEMBLY_ACC=CAM_ASM_000836 /TAXON_ID=2866 /ORGANISM="Crypthecodinium cohnii, Strain Seligo" /LENGTH=489 /DNA_ID=CAMNT_0053908755 /DNA_START=102 /DNA_END=1571 /DNA_ORIENTATION=-